MEGRGVLVWIPRVLGLAIAAFLSVFALDAFGHGGGVAVALADFGIHLIPALLVAGVVGVSWRRPRLGAFIFAILAVAYALLSHDHPSWVLTISGPLALVAALFFVSSRQVLRTQ